MLSTFVFKSCWISCRSFTELSRLCTFWAGSPSSTFRRKASTSSTNLVTFGVSPSSTSLRRDCTSASADTWFFSRASAKLLTSSAKPPWESSRADKASVKVFTFCFRSSKARLSVWLPSASTLLLSAAALEGADFFLGSACRRVSTAAESCRTSSWSFLSVSASLSSAPGAGFPFVVSSASLAFAASPASPASPVSPTSGVSSLSTMVATSTSFGTREANPSTCFSKLLIFSRTCWASE
mmetsp:Transcript_42595/g.92598  ORF Transcript_42595/g.92598 Transcript_42595/m.92598 type:complete len:239 (+) Transcript_42595:1079-1795(+)